MNVTQGDSFPMERIAALSSPGRIERAARFADSQGQRRSPNPAPDEDETDETNDEADDAPQDVIEWSAALREGLALTVVTPSRAIVLASPSPDSESRRLDLTV